MPMSMALASYSTEAAKGLVEMGPAVREEYLRNTLEAQGSKVVALYFIEGGEWDVVVIADIADEPAGAVATYLSGQALGLWTKWRGFRLFSGAEVQAALAKVVPLTRPGS